MQHLGVSLQKLLCFKCIYLNNCIFNICIPVETVSEVNWAPVD